MQIDGQFVEWTATSLYVPGVFCHFVVHGEQRNGNGGTDAQCGQRACGDPSAILAHAAPEDSLGAARRSQLVDEDKAIVPRHAVHHRLR